MKRIVAGIVAHVDSGKTTLSEAILYSVGKIAKPGRVDHGDSFLDTDALERERGITVFSKQAVIYCDDTKISLIDTPGHVDFSAETERTFSVLDCAILVISAVDGVMSHTKTLWKLLRHYDIPTFIFVNKMDIAHAGKEKIYSDIKKSLSPYCLDFSVFDDEFYENAASCSEELMDEYFSGGILKDDSISDAIFKQKIFPCCFGSALKNEGVRDFLHIFEKYSRPAVPKSEFGAKVYKISDDSKGMRLTHLKITGGSLHVKDILKKGDNASKVNEIRIYSGDSYIQAWDVHAGDVCAVTGPVDTYSGEGFGCEKDNCDLVCEPMFSYSVRLPKDCDVTKALSIFKKLSVEETQLGVSYDSYLQKISVKVMGDIQLEILQRVLEDRFGLCVEFESGSVIYKETIANAVVGVGHYEPLRHYCEVQLLLEPASVGEGLIFKTNCSEDVLSKNWQRLVLTHLAEKNHLGVLTGSPITDMKITLINGKAHEKHTEGGDFRQATYRAVRQGLMQAKSVLLEPWVKFYAELPTSYIGKFMTDLKMMSAEFDSPESDGEYSHVSGIAPASKISGYGKDVVSYTKGMAKIGFGFDAYRPCIDSDKVISDIGYNAESDLDNTPDSVFCSHGSGYTVKWNEVFEHMHLPLYNPNKNDDVIVSSVKKRRYDSLIADESELLKIFEDTYGKIRRKKLNKLKTESYIPKKASSKSSSKINTEILPEYLLIDGYNVIFAVDELKEISEDNPDAARNLLITRLCNYAAMKKNNVILVFDAYRVKGSMREVERINNISVVYTKEAETADTYIEKTSVELAKKYRVRVATSDAQEQMIVFGGGALRVSAKEFYRELCDTEDEMRRYINENKS